MKFVQMVLQYSMKSFVEQPVQYCEYKCIQDMTTQAPGNIKEMNKKKKKKL